MVDLYRSFFGFFLRDDLNFLTALHMFSIIPVITKGVIVDDLSNRQREVLDFIQQTIMIKKLPPTYREIGDALNISSTNGVSDHVKALIRKGYIEKPKGKGSSARGLLLTEKVEMENQTPFYLTLKSIVISAPKLPRRVILVYNLGRAFTS